MVLQGIRAQRPRSAYCSCPYWAQNNGVATVAPLEKARVKRSEDFSAKMSVQLKPGFHVNSNARR